MQKEFKLPELGENIESADIVNVLVNEGDFIKKDQGVVEIETDKATIEVPSTIEGKITKLFVKAGDKIKVGSTIMIVEEEVAEPEKQTEAPAEQKKEEKPTEVKTEKPPESKADNRTKSIREKRNC